MKTYFLKKSRKVSVAVVFVVFLIVILFTMYLFAKYISIFMSIIFIPGLLGAIIAFISSNTIHRMSLSISDTAIAYNAGLFSIQAKWTDVQAIESIRAWVMSRQDCLVGTAYYKINLPEFIAKTNDIQNLQMTSRKFSIPLEAFADNWRDSELGQQIKQYAPQLFPSVEN